MHGLQPRWTQNLFALDMFHRLMFTMHLSRLSTQALNTPQLGLVVCPAFHSMQQSRYDCGICTPSLNFFEVHCKFFRNPSVFQTYAFHILSWSLQTNLLLLIIDVVLPRYVKSVILFRGLFSMSTWSVGGSPGVGWWSTSVLFMLICKPKSHAALATSDVMTGYIQRCGWPGLHYQQPSVLWSHTT